MSSRSILEPVWTRLMLWDAVRAAFQFKAILDKRHPVQGIPDMDAYDTACKHLVKAVTTSEDEELQKFVMGFLSIVCRFEMYYEGCVYTGKEWRDNNEDYGENADLMISCEGDVCHSLYYNGCPEAVEELNKLCDVLNMEIEWTYCWAFKVRKKT